MNKKSVLIIALIAIIIVSITVVSVGFFNNSNIKTHEFNYANKATFNLSDDLTNETGVEDIVFGEGVSYAYSSNSSFVSDIGGISSSLYDDMDTVKNKQNDTHQKQIESNSTSQGYETYIFQWDNNDEYNVYIVLNNMTIVEDNGDECQYDYFWAKFKSLDEAKIFIETFKINESVLK